MNIFFKELWSYRELLIELIKRDLRVKYRKSVLGYLWSLLNPLLMMMVVSTVFSYMFRFDIVNFPMYLLTGQTLFNFFSEATNMAMSSITNSGSLIKKVYLPKQVFPVSRMLSSFVTFLFSLLAIVIIMIITRVKVTWTILLVPLPLIYILIFTIGVGLVLSIMSTYFRDVIYLWGVFITAWMYFTPIFYPISQLPEFASNLMRFNPMFQMLQCFREIVLYGTFPSWHRHVACIVCATVSLTIGIYVFRKKQGNLILHL
ncbi:hypothetical protein LAD12857_37860 [Lacrimispora amygdalina]|uniref:Transport permease protein n=1 Tax=Lacrimispora amygdalina TaxID=253257 RepID=A0ABQ5MAM0_9FIRM